MSRQKKGRPKRSHQVRVTPEYKEIDVEQLGRVLIAAAINIAQKKLAEADKQKGKGDDMT